MTDEELQAIRREVDAGHMIHALHVKWLLAEVERLRETDRNMGRIVDTARDELAAVLEQNAALREIAQAVAGVPLDEHDSNEDDDTSYMCFDGFETARHWQEKARALLASEGGQP